MMIQVSDVIWHARKEGGMTAVSNQNIVGALRNIAQRVQAHSLATAAAIEYWAEKLEQRHDHGDPCDDTACPCRKAEADDWRDQGLARP